MHTPDSWLILHGRFLLSTVGGSLSRRMDTQERKLCVWNTSEREHVFLKKKKKSSFTMSRRFYRKSPFLKLEPESHPECPLQGMLSSRGPGSKRKRRLSAPGGPRAPERFMGKPSAVPSLSWVTFGPRRANSTTVLGSSQYVKWVIRE